MRRSARQLRAANSWFTRLSAVEILADPKSLPPWEREEAYRILLGAIDDPDAFVRSSAAMALTQRRDHAGEVLPLLSGLTKDKDPHVRVAALFAMERFPVRGSPEADPLVAAAVAALEDPKPQVRLEAGRALYVFGQGRRSLPAMARLVREENGSLRMGALGWLIMARTIPKDLEPDLRKMAKGDYVWERIWARRALVQLGIPDRERAAMIEAALQSSSGAERLDAAESLIKLGKGHTAIPVLRQLATSGDKGMEATAERMLFELGRTDRDPP